MVPKIVERKILKIKKPSGLTQFLMTLPKEYGEKLESRGIDTLLVAFDEGLGVFPKATSLTEKSLLTFLSKHSDLEKLFSEAKPPATRGNASDICDHDSARKRKSRIETSP
jgi:hypothetical protein